MASTLLSSPQHLHIALFPFMSKGHTIPLLHLTKLIHNHRPEATFTIFTTQANKPFISASLSSLPPTSVTIVSLPFSTTNRVDIPLGVESTDQLPSMSLFHSFAYATENLKPYFETTLEDLQRSHNPISFLISDGFLYWTQESSSKFNILRFVFYGMSMYSHTIARVVGKRNNAASSVKLVDDESMHLPEFPWISFKRKDFGSILVTDPEDAHIDLVAKCTFATSMSCGMVVNSFNEIEQPFVDYWNSKILPQSWCVGPFCLVEKQPTLERQDEKPYYIKWLDKLLSEGKNVLYVAFGSQAEISTEQLKEITIGLEKSGVNFIWVLRMKSNQIDTMRDFEERVKGSGLVVRSWVDQRMILEHKSVRGFMSHCGWNSAIESICAGVPILAWPMMAEQHLNAKKVVEDIEVGLRIDDTCDGSRQGFVKWEGLSKMVRELMEGEMGIKVRKNVKYLSEVAIKSVEEVGSSWCNLESLLNGIDYLKGR